MTKRKAKFKRTFIIDRAEWRCGGPHARATARGKGQTKLLNKQGYMCCLGQISEQCGFPREALLNKLEPRNVESGDVIGLLREKIPGNHVLRNTELARQAMLINDDYMISQDTREEMLTKLFAKHKIELIFMGEF